MELLMLFYYLTLCLDGEEIEMHDIWITCSWIIFIFYIG